MESKSKASFKASETLLGIETVKLQSQLKYLMQCLGASKPLKPFQGLKLIHISISELSNNASKPLKPFQGLKHTRCRYFHTLLGFKASETLLGIETQQWQLQQHRSYASKPLKPFQGLKPPSPLRKYPTLVASKPLKPFQGLKLLVGQVLQTCIQASKPLKPFQGLKLSSSTNLLIRSDASKPLKPFQGLKHQEMAEYFADRQLQSL